MLGEDLGNCLLLKCWKSEDATDDTNIHAEESATEARSAGLSPVMSAIVLVRLWLGSRTSKNTRKL